MRSRIALFALIIACGYWTVAQAQNSADRDDKNKQTQDADRDNKNKQTQNKDKDDQAKRGNVKLTNGPVLEDVRDDKATIAWSTNENASTVLKYGTSPNNLDHSAQQPWGGHTHRVYLKNLQPNTTYYYRVESAQSQGTGTKVMSGVETFKTKTEEAARTSAPAQPAAASSQAAAPNYNQAELRNFDQFLDAHANIRAELTQNPGLVNDPNYLRQRPALAQFLQTHRGVQASLQSNPAAFMHGETGYSSTEDRNTALHNFHQFLQAHPNLNAELSKNPALAKDPNYLASHPQLNQFLQTHGGVRAGLDSDPAGFMRAALTAQ
ncbi:MAG TPA: fibronectin type III domain-containing protein [Terriglobales bacterium]|nr:fibronectin type III domain-containing protein [Terriglobales bacterium]